MGFLSGGSYGHLLRDEVVIALWPSPLEINAGDENDNLYLGGLTTFYHSLDELEWDLYSTAILQGWTTHAYRSEVGKLPTLRAQPPIIADFLVWVGTSSLLASAVFTLYKALDLWVKKVNGRRIKVKFYDFEIETTQLTDSLRSYYKKFWNSREKSN